MFHLVYSLLKLMYHNHYLCKNRLYDQIHFFSIIRFKSNSDCHIMFRLNSLLHNVLWNSIFVKLLRVPTLMLIQNKVIIK